MLRFWNGVICSLLVIASSARLGLASEVVRSQTFMGDICEIIAVGPNEARVNDAIDAAFAELTRMENIFSLSKTDSEVTKINKTAYTQSVACSPDMVRMLNKCKTLRLLTNGAFDITVGPLMALWHSPVTTDWPTQEQVDRARALIGSQFLLFNGPAGTISFERDGMAIDFGAIAKGTAMDQAMQKLDRKDVTHAIIKSGHLALANERATSTRRATSTSNQVVDYRVLGGKRAGSVIDPATGYPAAYQGNVTVIGPSAADAQALSTTLVVMGPENGMELVKKDFKHMRAEFSATKKK